MVSPTHHQSFQWKKKGQMPVSIIFRRILTCLFVCFTEMYKTDLRCMMIGWALTSVTRATSISWNRALSWASKVLFACCLYSHPVLDNQFLNFSISKIVLPVFAVYTLSCCLLLPSKMLLKLISVFYLLVVCSFLLLSNILLYEYNTIHLS